MDNETTEEIKRYFDDSVAGLRGEIRQDVRADIEAAVGGLRADMNSAVGGLRDEMNTAVGGLRADMNADMNSAVTGLRAEMNSGFADLRADVEGARQHTDLVAEDLRAEIRDVKRHSEVLTESLRSDIRLVAEGVAGLDEKFTQEFVNVRAEMREQSDDLKSLIRAGYADLDRRISNPS